MAYEQKNNSGTLFPNDRKETENHPDMKGKALIGGKWYWVSLWHKSGAKGAYKSTSYTEMTSEQVAKYGGGGAATTSATRPGSYGGNRVPQKPVKPTNQAAIDDALGGEGIPDDDIPFAPNRV